MNKQTLTSLLAVACISFLGASSHAQTRIIPFGDSVTANGAAPESSYRYWLWQYLQNGGYNVDFIGTQNGVADGAPANSDFDQNYEGGDGWSSADALYATEHGVAAENPDVVLLDFGANDILDGVPASTVRLNLQQIMEDFHAVNPGVRILIALPTEWFPMSRAEKRAVSQLKGAIKAAAKTEKKAGVHVTVVNLSSSFNAKKDTKDGTHPNTVGEQKIAKKYYSALRKVLGRP